MDEEDIVAKLRLLDPVNKEYLDNYVRYNRLRNVAETTIKTKCWKIYGFLMWSEFRDAKQAAAKDFENFYLHRKNKKAGATAFGDLQELRVFYKWLIGKDPITFRPQRPRNDIPPEKVLQPDNIRALLEVCESQRDRALVSIAWDSAGRISEILDTNIGHVAMDRYGAIVSVKGKTGRRPIRLVNAVPDLQAWLNIHPLKDNPDAPLFVTSRRRGSGAPTRITVRRVQNLFKRLGDLAGCPKDCNPHAFRHGRLTARGRQLTEPELRDYAGWSKGSAMPRVYVHLSSRDIDSKILAADGVVQEEAPAPDPMASVECPRCKYRNAPDALFCSRCSCMLTDEAVRQYAQLKALDENPDVLLQVATEIRAGKDVVNSTGKN